jgi:hypothetical protein
VEFGRYRSETANNVVGMRLALKAITDPAIREIPPDKKVYIGWLDTEGYEFFAMKYELLPRVSNKVCFSFVASQPAPHFQTCVISEAELSAMFRNYDYAILGNGLARMKQDFPSIWHNEIPDNAKLFRIHSDKTSVRAVPLEP